MVEMPPNWRALTLVTGWCGLRIGEAAGLRRGDVDLSAGILRIAQTAQYVGTPVRLVIGPPKSERGIRLVHMPQHVTDAMAEYIAEREPWKSQDHILTRKDGQPLSRHTVLAACRSAANACGHEWMVWPGTTQDIPPTHWPLMPALARKHSKHVWAMPTRRSALSPFTPHEATTANSLVVSIRWPSVRNTATGRPRSPRPTPRASSSPPHPPRERRWGLRSLRLCSPDRSLAPIASSRSCLRVQAVSATPPPVILMVS